MNNSTDALTTYKKLSNQFVGNMAVAIDLAGTVFTRDGNNSIDHLRAEMIRMGMERAFCADVHVIDEGCNDDFNIGDLHYVEGTRQYVSEVRRLQEKNRDATLLVISTESIMSGKVNRRDIELLSKDYAAVIVQCA